MMSPIECPKCHTYHSFRLPLITRRVGWLPDSKVTGFVARDTPGAPVRATREQAANDYCHARTIK